MRLEGVNRVEQRLDMVLAPERYGLGVSEVCSLWGVSRQTFYVWRRRYEAEGLGGLGDRSSRPTSSPGRMPSTLENRIADLRRAHPRWGPRRIRAELARQGLDPPARSTIERVLARNGLRSVAVSSAAPPRRFVRDAPNELWQLDGKDWVLADGTEVHIISVLDDHSRYCGATVAFFDETGQAAITVFDRAVAELGLPESTLADRGSIFTGRRTNCVVAFERHVWAYGVYTINGRGYHPQTQGKIERFHRTLIEWLEDNGPYRSLRGLNRSLEAFRQDYNHQRPHQALDDTTPAQVWAATPPAGPDPQLAAQRCRRQSLHTVQPNGTITYGPWFIAIGTAWARTKVQVIDVGHIIEIHDADGQLIREVKPDRDKHYLGTGNPRGRRPRQ
jgi:transposase InsO family protein